MKKFFVIFFCLIGISCYIFGEVKYNTEKYCLVQGGTFIMGIIDENENQLPKYIVTLNYNYIMGKYEITFEEYDLYCEQNDLDLPGDEGWGRGKRPVINIKWIDAVKYCNWLSKIEGLQPAYDKNNNFLDKEGNITTDITKVEGYRLPTEAEWEFAARGGNLSNNYKYSGSNNIDEVAWYKDNSEKMTHEVGTKFPNELEIYDMSGNVWEFCNDFSENLSNKEVLNPLGPSQGFTRIWRGGGWYGGIKGNLVTFRGSFTPGKSSDYLGFRICRTE